MLHDEFTENEDGSETSVVCDVANSFDEFLDILYSDNDFNLDTTREIKE